MEAFILTKIECKKCGKDKFTCIVVGETTIIRKFIYSNEEIDYEDADWGMISWQTKRAIDDSMIGVSEGNRETEWICDNCGTKIEDREINRELDTCANIEWRYPY